MKLLITIFLAIVAVKAQDPSVTDILIASQADLSLGHAFFEKNIAVSRSDLSKFIENDVRQLLDSHMEAYGSIKQTSLETTAAIDALEVNEDTEACLIAIRARWELQITRYGHSLSNCIETSNRSLFSSF